jgi:hypothetical protein
VGTVCGNPARTDLSGGRSAMDVPTAIEPMAIAVRGTRRGPDGGAAFRRGEDLSVEGT